MTAYRNGFSIDGYLSEAQIEACVELCRRTGVKHAGVNSSATHGAQLRVSDGRTGTVTIGYIDRDLDGYSWQLRLPYGPYTGDQLATLVAYMRDHGLPAGHRLTLAEQTEALGAAAIRSAKRSAGWNL